MTMLFFVAMSIMTLSLGTVSDLRVSLPACQYRNHLLDLISQADDYDYHGSAVILMKNLSCDIRMNQVRTMAKGLFQYMNYNYFNHTKMPHDVSGDSDDYSDTYYEDLFDTFLYDHNEYYDYEIEKPQLLRAMAEIKNLPDITKRHDVLTYLDIAPVVVFTIELILQLATCPNYKRFFKTWLNVLDIVILVSASVGLVLEFKIARYRFNEKGIKILMYLQMFRVLRVMRYIQHVPAVQVLVFTVRTNCKDLAVIISFVLMGVLIFGNFAYFVEDKSEFTNIPTSWWWGLITMTTVGYGDVVPKTCLGKIVGSLCALCGVICLSITIPVFVNNFISLYEFSKIYGKCLKGKYSAKICPLGQKYEEGSVHAKTGQPVLQPREKVKSFSIFVKPANVE
ncbi:potassium voltage-gated channel subfamily B member 2-like [Pecten maximus]|uniref:potassium voltage-gated channel subfamily B member 2-like n=1 Tax=Pecten maximus TaxID=6579 RepID=UPI00145890CD|nr:potassium voltage-gated channel subfamily B member 2-like [Pecten maximus]